MAARRLAGAVSCALLVAVAAGCGKAPRHAALPAGSVVLALGDSVTFGTGAGPGEDFPARLAALTGWRIENRGVPGDIAAGARDRLDEALEDVRPALVIVEIGGNDFLRRHGDATVKENIRAILRRVRQTGAPAVLVAVPKFSPLGAAMGRLPDAALYAELADEEKVVLVPGVFGTVLADPALKADPIHPNAAGYRALAEGIAATLRESGLLAKR